MSRTAIVLAGGRSSRFGGDKLAAPFGDGTILTAAVAAVELVADGVIVAGTGFPAGFHAGDVPVAVMQDRAPFEGPLVALEAVLATAERQHDDLAIVVAGDMPRVVPAVLVAMLDHLQANATLGAVLLGRHEAAIAPSPPDQLRRQVLPLAIRVKPASRAAREAVEAGHRSLQALVERMTASELPPSVWLPLDTEAATLTDVDTRADLDRLQPS